MPDFPDSSSGSPRGQFVFTNVEFSKPINENGATKECSPDFENCPRKCTTCKKTKSHDYYEGNMKSCVSCLAKKKVYRDLVRKARKARTGEKLPSTHAEKQEIALIMADEPKDSDDDDHPSKKKRISHDSDYSRPNLDEGSSTISSSASGAGTSSGVDSSTTPECPPCLTAESKMVVHHRKGSSKRDAGTSFSELLGMSEVIPLVGFIILGLIGIVTCFLTGAQYLSAPKYPEFRNLLGEDQGNTNPQTHLICTLCLLGVCPIFVFIALKRFTFKKERHDVDQDLELNQRSMTR